MDIWSDISAIKLKIQKSFLSEDEWNMSGGRGNKGLRSSELKERKKKKKQTANSGDLHHQIGSGRGRMTTGLKRK